MVKSPDTLSEDAPPSPRFGPSTRANPFWRLVLVAGALFCFSCLLWTTASFADPAAPGNRWLNHNGLWLVVVTGVTSIAAALLAMGLDTVQTRQMEPASDSDPDGEPSAKPDPADTGERLG